MGELSPWHLLIVAAVFVLLFGSKRLPDAARSLGRSLRIFKAETKALHTDDAPATPPVLAAPVSTPVTAAPVTAAPVTAAPVEPTAPVATDESR